MSQPEIVRGTRASWVSACVAAMLVVAVGCGGDDGGSTTIETKDSGSSNTTTTHNDASTTKSDAGSSAGSDAGGGTTDDPVAGEAVAKANACASCHGTDYSGVGNFPNLTPDEDTGLGSWTASEIKNAIVSGVDKDGNKLCAGMAKYPLSTTDANNLVAFLQSLPPVSNEIQIECSR